MRLKLVSLVQADPVLALYALEHLGEGVPTKTVNTFYSDMIHGAARQISEDLLRKMLSNDPAHQLTPEQLARVEKIWGKRAEDLKNLMPIAQSLVTADVATVRAQLRGNNPEVRKLALQVVARRRLPLESELIDLLDDTKLGVPAHDALVRVARGIDFGPLPFDRKGQMKRTIKKWRSWLALQQDARMASRIKGAVAVAKPGKADPIQPLQLLLEQDDRELSNQRPEATRLCDELLSAKDNEQRSILARWREAAGDDHTDALAVAIPKLLPALRTEAEDALTQRLSNLPTATLRDKLQDDNVEVRRAAAFACGRKLAHNLIADLVQLLEDPEKDVIQAARAALTELTGEDFGPTKDASAQGRAEAVAAWRKWYKDHAGTSK